MSQPGSVIAEAFVRLVVDDLLPAETAAEQIIVSGGCPHLPLTEVTNLVAAAAEALTTRDRLRAEPSLIWQHVPDEYEYVTAGSPAELEVAEAVSARFDVEYEDAIAQLSQDCDAIAERIAS